MIAQSIRTVLINIVVLFSMLGAAIVLPAAIDDLSSSFSHATKFNTDDRASLAIYKDAPWANTHFGEFNNLSTTYYDFIGWRRKPVNGQTITIDEDGYRRHKSKATSATDADIWLFGGSTMWGTGARDDETIPAYLEMLSARSTFNFGESGYVAHQELNLLMKEYLQAARPKVVIFYDGVNEILHKCRKELGFFSTSEEAKIRSMVDPGASEVLRTFSPLLKIFSKSMASKNYDCDVNTHKSEMIAKSLVQDWTVAKSLIESNGGKFVAILQPVSFIGNPSAAYLQHRSDEESLKRQYEILYPLIRKELLKSGVSYIDLTGIFDGSRPFYIDFCHVAPDGNRVVAGKILDALSVTH